MRVKVGLLCVLGWLGCSNDSADGVGDLYRGPTSPPMTSPPSPPPSSPVSPPPNPPSSEAPVQTVGNPFVLTESDPLSTFAVDVDTASYDIFRRALQSGTLPNPSEVRVEEYVNYFRYTYPAPAPGSDLPFAISLAVSPQIAQAPTKLLRVGLQGVLAEKRPANLVFLVDVSGSMDAPNKLPLVKLVLREALSVLDSSDRVSIVTYAGSTGVALAPTEVRQRSAIVGVLEALSAGGGTNGSSGIELAYAQAAAGLLEGGINHVILCTDGDFNLGLTSDDALVRLIEQKRASGVTLTALGFGERNNDAMMERVSNAGNGSYSVLFDQDQAIAYAHQRLLSSMLHIAKDVKIQIEFNPSHVYAYRLLGYEDRALADGQFRDDRVDAGELGSGHQVTALYELAASAAELPASVMPSRGEPSALPSGPALALGELMRVRLRFKRPDATETDAAREVSATLLTSAIAPRIEQLDDDAVWAMGVASLAEQLRSQSSPYPLDFVALQTLLAARASVSPERAELISLLPQVRSLLGR